MEIKHLYWVYYIFSSTGETLRLMAKTSDIEDWLKKSEDIIQEGYVFDCYEPIFDEN